MKAGLRQHAPMSCTLKEKILKLDRPVPRYTSYPTAPYFKSIKDNEAPVAWVENLPEEETISLYLHIPFCPKLCWYCGCHTKITKRYSPVEDYIQLLLHEIDILSGKLSAKNEVVAIHFGGGSPGMLKPPDFLRIMEKLRVVFAVSPKADISIELDPRNVTEGRVAAYAKSGVNRISLGVQDFNPAVLESVNRQQPFYLTYKAMQLFKEYGITNINFDLMYGLPYQTEETIKNTMDKVLFLRPSRVAFFGYAHVPWMKKHMRLIDEDTLPGKHARYDLFEIGTRKINKAGYESIGIDHFARPDDPMIKAYKEKKLKRNFQGYTTDSADNLIGIGLSSISRFSEGFIQNAADMPGYRASILNNELPIKKYHQLTKEDKLRSAVIEQVMCYGEADIGKLCTENDFDKGFLDREILDLSDYIDQGFVIILQDRKIIIPVAAHFIVRMVCSVFDGNIDNFSEEQRHASAI